MFNDWWTPEDDMALEQDELFEAGYYDNDTEPDPEPPCEHRHWSEAAAYPDRPGRCAVLAVCENCGEVLGQMGVDSVL